MRGCPEARPALVSADGPAAPEALRQIATLNAVDLFAVSRPTLVRLLDHDIRTGCGAGTAE